jgi:hypothetical protein
VLCLEENKDILLNSFASLSPSVVALNYDKVVVVAGCVAVMIDPTECRTEVIDKESLERSAASVVDQLLSFTPEEEKKPDDDSKYDIDYLICRWSCEESLLTRFFWALGSLLGRYIRVGSNEVRTFREAPSESNLEVSQVASEAMTFTNVSFNSNELANNAIGVDVTDPNFWNLLLPKSNID